MSLPVKFPEIYERISPIRSDDDIERELNRRCGYPVSDAVAPCRSVDPATLPREGTSWVRPLKQKRHEPLPAPQDRRTCSHESGTTKDGVGRERCRACGTTRTVGKSTWKRVIPLRKSKCQL